MSYEEHLRIALEKKDIGNNHFKNGEINQAIRYYHEAILYLRTMIQSPGNGMEGLNSFASRKGGIQLTEAMKKEAISNTIAVYSNLAACHTKTNKWERVIDCSNKALDFDPNHVKSLFRKGLALNRSGRVDEASKELMKALKFAPNDANIIKELHLTKQKEREAIEKQKKKLMGMFERGQLS